MDISGILTGSGLTYAGMKDAQELDAERQRASQEFDQRIQAGNMELSLKNQALQDAQLQTQRNQLDFNNYQMDNDTNLALRKTQSQFTEDNAPKWQGLQNGSTPTYQPTNPLYTSGTGDAGLENTDLGMNYSQAAAPAKGKATWNGTDASTADAQGNPTGLNFGGNNAISAAQSADNDEQNKGTDWNHELPQGKYQLLQQMMQVAQQHGDYNRAQQIRKAIIDTQTEGLNDAITTMLQGGSDKQIEDIYNANGSHRIIPGSLKTDAQGNITATDTDGKPYSFNAMQYAHLHGLLPEVKLQDHAPGSTITAINPATGQPKIIGQAAPAEAYAAEPGRNDQPGFVYSKTHGTIQLVTGPNGQIPGGKPQPIMSEADQKYLGDINTLIQQRLKFDPKNPTMNAPGSELYATKASQIAASMIAGLKGTQQENLLQNPGLLANAATQAAQHPEQIQHVGPNGIPVVRYGNVNIPLTNDFTRPQQQPAGLGGNSQYGVPAIGGGQAQQPASGGLQSGNGKVATTSNPFGTGQAAPAQPAKQQKKAAQAQPQAGLQLPNQNQNAPFFPPAAADPTQPYFGGGGSAVDRSSMIHQQADQNDQLINQQSGHSGLLSFGQANSSNMPRYREEQRLVSMTEQKVGAALKNGTLGQVDPAFLRVAMDSSYFNHAQKLMIAQQLKARGQ